VTSRIRPVAWQAIPVSERMKIALAIARRRGPDLRRRYPNVLSVGAGFRSRSRVAIADEVCLRYWVSRKLKRWRPGLIPGEITAYVARRGRRSLVRIPTDVTEFRGGRPHRDLTAGIVSKSGGKLIEYGSACCLVTRARTPRELYLLTCYHVMSPDMSVPTREVSCIDCSDNSQLGVLATLANTNTPGDPVDAELISIQPGLAPLAVWGRTAASKASDADLSTLTTATSVLLVRQHIPPSAGGGTPRQGPIPATFQSILPTNDFEYPGVGTYTFQDTIEYTADVHGGDSGSALIDCNGKLYGMHFYGMGDFGYALSAPRLFESGAFPIDIWLA